MDEAIAVIMIFGTLFVALPWLILHYVTKWKAGNALPVEDERLLDELYELARRLEDRVHTVERIVAADNPDFRPSIRDAQSLSLRDEREEEARLSYRPERSN